MSRDPNLSPLPVIPVYASRGIYRPPSPWLNRLAIAFGIIPLVSGVGSLLLFLLTRDDLFTVTGLLTLPVGGILFITGVSLLVLDHTGAMRAPTIDRKRRWLQTLLVLAVLLVNIPAAIVCIDIGAGECYRIYFTLTNASSQTLDRYDLDVDQVKTQFDPIPPGATATQSIIYARFNHIPTGCSFTARSAGQEISGTCTITPAGSRGHFYSLTFTGTTTTSP